MKFLNLLLKMFDAEGKVGEKIAEEVKIGLSPIAPFVRRVSAGALFIICSGVAWLGGVFCLLLALFFYLAMLDVYIMPAILTAVVSWLVALILVTIGIFLLRPR